MIIKICLSVKGQRKVRQTYLQYGKNGKWTGLSLINADMIRTIILIKNIVNTQRLFKLSDYTLNFIYSSIYQHKIHNK